MSVQEVSARIYQLQGQLGLLRPVAPSGAGSAGAGFAGALDAATGVVASGDGARIATANPLGSTVVERASQYLGMPYVWGGSSPADGGMDCSGLVQHVFASVGVDLPRLSADQARAGVAVPDLDQAQPGDLIAWDNSSRNVGADHIAIYVGDGKMIEAPRTGLDIRLVDVPSTPDYIRRVLPSGAPSAPSAAAVPPAGSDPLLDGVAFRSLFEAAGSRYGVDPRLLSAVARQESGYDPRAVSPAGAQGLMQLMPGTAAGLGVTDSFDPAQAVDGAARLLRQLLDRFDGRLDLALAGYNAGPGAVDRYDGVPPYPETRGYVASITAMLEGR